jgi:hypothetical protein
VPVFWACVQPQRSLVQLISELHSTSHNDWLRAGHVTFTSPIRVNFGVLREKWGGEDFLCRGYLLLPLPSVLAGPHCVVGPAMCAENVTCQRSRDWEAERNPAKALLGPDCSSSRSQMEMLTWATQDWLSAPVLQKEHRLTGQVHLSLFLRARLKRRQPLAQGAAWEGREGGQEGSPRQSLKSSHHCPGPGPGAAAGDCHQCTPRWRGGRALSSELSPTKKQKNL